MTRLRAFGIIPRLLHLMAILMLPAMAAAQEASITGTITDSTGGVLPGVVVRAVHEETGNSFEAVTDERGAFRIPVRIGVYRISAELAGFASVTRTGFQVLVGQEARITLQMAPAALQESVTVTGETPLVDTASSTLGTNIDPRQMQDIPLQGRNWMDLALLAPGSRQNASSGVPEERQGFSQINVDGQQVTNLIASTDSDQPKYSRDAIAEFEIISNRFDARQGRSAGFLVNAVTKSGTNTPSGTVSGYFRDDTLNAADFIQKRVLPYQNQQLGATFGGPIVKDRIHYFVNYEYEREPKTITYTSPFPFFNIDLHLKRTEQKTLGRGDFQFSPRSRLSARGQWYDQDYPSGGGATSHPSAAQTNQRYSKQAWGTWTRVLGTRAVNEVSGGYSSFTRGNNSLVRYNGGCNPSAPKLTADRCYGTPTITFTGYSVGFQTGQQLTQGTSQVRDDYSTSFVKHGRHDIKLGGEYLYNKVEMIWCAGCLPQLDSRGGPIPANIGQLIPVWNDVATWNLAPLSSITRRVTQQVSSSNFTYYPITKMAAAWLQDDWKVTARLTLNAGVRWDLTMGAYTEKLVFKPWLPGDLPYDWNNIAPRTGFAYTLTDSTVLRGGYGIFYTQSTTDEAHQSLSNTVVVGTERVNDGRPDFASNPYNGPTPTFAQALANACDINPSPTCLRRRTASGEINLTPRAPSPYSQQASIGFQHQIGSATGVEFDYVYNGARHEERSYNINLTWNPATGANLPFSDIPRRPFPQWADVIGATFDGWSNSHSLQTSLNKRMRNRWQASANYTLSWLRDGDPVPFQFGLTADGKLTRSKLSFPVKPDVGGEYSLATGDQRHRATANGIWQVGRGVQLSGLYFFGSGRRFSTSYGGDPRDAVNLSGGTGRLRPDGTIVQRNSLVGKPLHRVDLRLQKRLSLGGRRTLDGILETFNLFNHANYGSYTTQESNASFGRPSFNDNIAYQPRTLQIGFRLVF